MAIDLHARGTGRRELIASPVPETAGAPVCYGTGCEEATMDATWQGRRGFLKGLVALGAVGVPIAAVVRPRATHSADARGGPRMKYDPAAHYDLKIIEEEFRRAPGGRMLVARIYQPQGMGPFPT